MDVEAATKGGIKVARIPSGDSGNALSCAEHAIYLIFGLLRNQVCELLHHMVDYVAPKQQYPNA